MPDTSAPLTNATKPADNFFGGLGDILTRASNQFLQLQVLKSFQDMNDNEFGYTYDPVNGLQIANTKTIGSAGPRSLWRATDMLWVGGAAVLVLAVVAFKR